MDENGAITINKAWLVAKGYSQDKGINYEENYVHVAHLEAIKFLLEFTCYLDFKLYQMSVKYVFLNDHINEEVCVS